MSGWSKYYSGGVNPDLYIRHLYGQREFLTAIIADQPKKVLEVGAGTGIMSVFLSQMGVEVLTIDNDPIILKQAQKIKEMFGGKNELMQGDAFSLNFPDNSQDIIFHQGLLEHFSDKQIHQLLNEHLRIAPVVWFSVPNCFYPKCDLGNERLMSKSAWEKILQLYKIEISHYYAKKIFPKWYLPRVPIQYMVKISRS